MRENKGKEHEKKALDAVKKARQKAVEEELEKSGKEKAAGTEKEKGEKGKKAESTKKVEKGKIGEKKEKAGAAAVKEKKKKEKVKLEIPKKPAGVLKRRDAVRKKKKKPVFRGRFGKKSVRKVGKKKWSKWRRPRGIDIKRKKEDGKWPRQGYGTSKEIKFVHPSGYNEKMVFNERELGDFPEQCAARIGASVGKRKRMLIVKKANEQKIRVLNY